MSGGGSSAGAQLVRRARETAETVCPRPDPGRRRRPQCGPQAVSAGPTRLRLAADGQGQVLGRRIGTASSGAHRHPDNGRAVPADVAGPGRGGKRLARAAARLRAHERSWVKCWGAGTRAADSTRHDYPGRHRPAFRAGSTRSPRAATRLRTHDRRRGQVLGRELRRPARERLPGAATRRSMSSASRAGYARSPRTARLRAHDRGGAKCWG